MERRFGHLYPKALQDITRSQLDDYVSHKRVKGNATATIVRDLNDLRSVFRRAVDGGFLRVSPFVGWEKPKVEDNGVTRYLKPEEEKRLRSAMKKRDDEARRARLRGNKQRVGRPGGQLPEIPESGFSDHLTPMVLLSVNTGLRFGEVSKLQWSAVDLRANVVTVSGRTSKSAKLRHVPLNKEAADVLTRWRGQCTGQGFVFSNPDGTRIASVKTAWLALLADAQINEFRWHDLRHSFASKLVQRGVDLVVVRELLGHSDFALTLRYAHLEPKQKAEAVARLGA